MALKIKAEIKIDTEPCVLAWDKALHVGNEDGSIKIFDTNLSLVSTWAAHGVQPFALAASGGKIYSTSNDGGIKVWSTQGERIEELATYGSDVEVLHVFGKHLYAGDEGGNVLVYEDNKEIAMYNVIEEVKDLTLSPPYLFTVRDLDVTVTEIQPDSSKKRFVTCHNMEGSAPMRIAGTRLLVMARGANNLKLHDATFDTRFKKLHEVKVSDMIVTSLSVSGDYAWTGGWDGHIRRWKIVEDQLQEAGNLNLEACINAIATPAPEEAYAILAGGRILHIKAT